MSDTRVKVLLFSSGRVVRDWKGVSIFGVRIKAAVNQFLTSSHRSTTNKNKRQFDYFEGLDSGLDSKRHLFGKRIVASSLLPGQPPFSVS